MFWCGSFESLGNLFDAKQVKPKCFSFTEESFTFKMIVLENKVHLL